MSAYPKSPFNTPLQERIPGQTSLMTPKPDHGEQSYVGHDRLRDKVAIITGGDSGIGRAVAIAYAREGADVTLSFLPEEMEDAKETASWVRKAGRKALLVPGDIKNRDVCREIVDRTVAEFGRLDILVNNAAFQIERHSLDEISEDEWDDTFATNSGAVFRMSRLAIPHMPQGGSLIHTISVNADRPKPKLLAYSATKSAIQNFSGGLAELLGEKGIRSNTVAPGPIWTPLIPATMDKDHVHEFGADSPMKRPGQPAELACAYVLLASDEASYISGANIAVTGGVPVI
ncbi:SDR family oxidoreductase [Gluconobacter wancherniae]|uniref:NAD(P)-dependent oxidoreductase n=1 Tax=Gluconobacter wancherniae NBRC 103581 TaxID=656744 RepID=A0A511AZ39_9PROT|nr:SDR family oxidoreductase [Gluconobacter wancherniae]MBF0852614.1 SDR family oxidoreductase [Gluconobacter wancherniae]MBS1093185.1 SDR family oxidoreductase [Gluconobacter wancherniae]GBD56674.1 oxidoreductase [Gluconobacter wancherniae NBRC 103581]GBR64332.1 dehydrogenase [Gluconobacter wancherniae NBRC 103581]GEK92421.1 NAD(P)-dependent oxidoreductase [Gluconobacter wancherniae NBRC 103581]